MTESDFWWWWVLEENMRLSMLESMSERRVVEAE